jgi:CheY-like chemotaxis protein
VHDLRTPINAILGYSSLLIEDTPDDAELHRRVEPVRRSGECLNDLIGALPRSGPLPADWLAAMQAPLAELETGIADLRSWDGAPQEDVDHIETARGRLIALLARLAVNEDPTATDSTPAPSPPLPEAVVRAGGGAAILVVDDNDLNRDLLSRRLQQLGHQVDEVGDGDTALRMLRRRPYDLLLLDIIMPGLDGFQVLELLQADTELAALPVLVISALTEMDSVARCIELGAVDFLPKNVDPVVLRARVHRSLEQKRARDRETGYLKDVAQLTAAAASVRDGQPVDEAAIDRVGERGDDLGELARAFGRMVQ